MGNVSRTSTQNYNSSQTVRLTDGLEDEQLYRISEASTTSSSSQSNTNNGHRERFHATWIKCKQGFKKGLLCVSKIFGDSHSSPANCKDDGGGGGTSGVGTRSSNTVTAVNSMRSSSSGDDVQER